MKKNLDFSFSPTKLATAVFASLVAMPVMASVGFTPCPTSIPNGVSQSGCALTGVGTQSLTIDTGGAISSNSPDGGGGVYMYGANPSGNFINNGRVSVLSWGVGVEGGASFGNIVNNGTISGNSLAGIAVLGSVNTIVNTGIVSGGINGNAIYVMSPESHVVNGITNSGLLDGAVILNDATLNLNGTVGRVTGSVSGTTGSIVNVNGLFSTGNTFNVGSLNIASGGILNITHAVTTANGFTNAGMLSIADGVLVTLTGNYTQASNGALSIGAKSNDAAGYGKLVVTGTANIDGKAAVDVKSVNTLAVGQKLMNVVAAGTLNGNFASVTDNSTMFNFRSLATTGANGHIDFEVLKGLTALQSVTDTNNNPSRGAASRIDSIVDGGATNPGMQSVIDTLGRMETEQQVSNAVTQMLPLLTGGSTAAAQGALSGISRVVQARIENNRGLSSGDTFMGDKQVWLKPFGSWAEQDNRNGVSGYKADTYGLIFGVDGTLSPVMRVGGAFAYAQSDINGKSSIASQLAKVDVYQLLGYGSYSLDERTEINFQAGYGQNTNKGSRQIAFMASTASSNYSSDTAQLGLGIGRTYPLNSQTSVTPSIRADYSWIKDKSYSENGAGALNLNVDGRTTDAFVIGVDAKLSHQLSEQTTLTASLGLGYDTINSQSAVTAAFSGAPSAAFVTYGINPDPWLVRGGFGAVYKLKNSVELNARYDLEYRESFLNQTASVKVRWAF